MTGANRVSSLYASVADADNDTGSEPLRAASSGSEREAASDTPRTLRAVAGLQDGAASRAPRRGKRAEQAVAANPRRRTAAAAPCASRKVLLRRAALAGAAIVLLGLGLIVSEEHASVPVLVPGASTADGGGESGGGDNPAGTPGTPTIGAGVPADAAADGAQQVEVPPSTATAAASADAAAQPEVEPAGVAPPVPPLGSAHEGAPQIVTSQATALPPGTAQPGTAQPGTAQPGTAQPGTAQPARAQPAMAQSAMAQSATTQGATTQGATTQGATAQGATAQGATAQGATAQGATAPAGSGANSVGSPGSPAGTPASHWDVVKPAAVLNSGTPATTQGLPAAVMQRAAATPSVAPALPSASARALAGGYVVQLGVFGDPDNAEILSRELIAQGYPAHLQSRVVLGPFADRQAAKAAAERLRGERKLEGLVVPPRKP